MGKPKRFSYSTRTLLIAITLVAVLCSLQGLRLIHTVRDRQVAVIIQRLGGRFDYGNSLALQDYPWYARLVSHFVNEDFSRITRVSVDGTKSSDEDVAVIAALSHLEGIDISGTDITDVGLEHLAATPTLRYVNATDTKITESYVSDLRKRRPNLLIDWRPREASVPTSDNP